MRGMALPISFRNSASNIIQDSSRGKTEGHIRYAPSDESTLTAGLRSLSESFRNSTMRGMALPISPRNAASNVIQDTSTGNTEGHVQYAPSDESDESPSASCGFFIHSTMRGMALPITSRNSASNTIQDTSRGNTKGHVRYAPSDANPLAAALQTSDDGLFRHSAMRGMALPISS